MRITIAQLEAFFWCARLGSVARAAQQLNLAQPTISLRIRDLQWSVGCQLFERVGRKLELSHEGTALLKHAQNVLDEVERIRVWRTDHDELTGVVRMGVPENFAISCLPILLRSIAAEHPGLQVESVVATSSRLENDAALGELDFAVVASATGDNRLSQVPLGLQEIVWAAAPDWQLPDTLRPSDLHRKLIITSPPPTSLHRTIFAWFHSAGLSPDQLALCDSVSVISELAVSGIAVALLPRKMVDRYVRDERLVTFAARPVIPKSPVFAVWRKSASTPAIRAVLGATRKALSQVDLFEPV